MPLAWQPVDGSAPVYTKAPRSPTTYRSIRSGDASPLSRGFVTISSPQMSASGGRCPPRRIPDTPPRVLHCKRRERSNTSLSPPGSPYSRKIGRNGRNPMTQRLPSQPRNPGKSVFRCVGPRQKVKKRQKRQYRSPAHSAGVHTSSGGVHAHVWRSAAAVGPLSRERAALCARATRQGRDASDKRARRHRPAAVPYDVFSERTQQRFPAPRPIRRTLVTAM